MGRRVRRLARGVLVSATAATFAIGILPAARAEAAGVTTHAWMAVDAIELVQNEQLHDLLDANRQYVRSGAHFPDSGYALSNTYGEEAHWQRFHDALADRILARTDCPDLTAIHGPCAPLIAFLMGAIGHGMGDEVWDWLFEPNGPDLDEYYTPDSLGGYATEGGAETQMDIVAIGLHGQPTTPTVSFPDHADLLAAFDAAGLTGIPDSQLSLGQVAMDVVHKAEAAWTPDHIGPVQAAMPWMSHNMVTAPGGVHFASKAIAGAFDSMWGHLQGERPQTSISITYPGDGERRIPATGWDREHYPGSARGRGGARTRITGVMTYARPYQHPGGPGVSNELPEGSMSLIERDTETAVPIRSGFPRSVPYGADAGEHMVDIQPAGDLTPCTWYRASITSNLLDAAGEPVAPHSWEFRTGLDADGNRCPDDPYTADENFARKVTSDVLDRSATEDELKDLGHDLARGTTRKGWVKAQLASLEERQKLVTEAFQHYLDRSPDPSGLAYWSSKLQSISLPSFHTRLAGSSEVYRRAGSTNAGYVEELYPLILGRSIDPSGAAYWTGRLDAGMTRTSLASRLLTSREASGHTVDDAYDDLLGRAPDPGGRTYWTNVLQRGTDPRSLWQSIILSGEYDRQAQD